MIFDSPKRCLRNLLEFDKFAIVLQICQTKLHDGFTKKLIIFI